jgi:preprotein translocase subunit YajC
MWVFLVYLVILALLFFVFIVVPQRRNNRLRYQMLATLVVGDTVLTTSGIYGTIRRLDPEDAALEIAPGLVITVVRNAIGAKVPARDEPGESANPEEHPEDSA